MPGFEANESKLSTRPRASRDALVERTGLGVARAEELPVIDANMGLVLSWRELVYQPWRVA